MNLQKQVLTIIAIAPAALQPINWLCHVIGIGCADPYILFTSEVIRAEFPSIFMPHNEYPLHEMNTKLVSQTDTLTCSRGIQITLTMKFKRFDAQLHLIDRRISPVSMFRACLRGTNSLTQRYMRAAGQDPASFEAELHLKEQIATSSHSIGQY